MRILLAGTPAIVIPIFEKIAYSDIEIAGVLTNPPKARGRSGALERSPVSEWAHQKGFNVYESGDLEECREILREVDLVFVVAFGRLIPEDFLKVPPLGWINLHFSRLPEARGAAPVQRLIAAGVTEISSTLFKLDKGMDTGPIFCINEPVSVAGLTTGQAWESLVSKAAETVVENLHAIKSGLSAVSQSEEQVKVAIAPKISSEEARIDWRSDVHAIARKILAFNPTPSAWTTFRGTRFIIHRAFAHNSERSIDVGRLIIRHDGIFVQASNGLVEVVEVQPAGKKRMLAIDWARGSRIEDGDFFE